MKGMARQLNAELSAQVVKVHEYISGFLNHSFRSSSTQQIKVQPRSQLQFLLQLNPHYFLISVEEKLISTGSWSSLSWAIPSPHPYPFFFSFSIGSVGHARILRRGGLKPQHDCFGAWKQQQKIRQFLKVFVVFFFFANEAT